MADLLERYRGWLTVLLLIAFALGAVLWWQRRPLPGELAISTPTQKTDSVASLITVDVSGAVLRPGVYQLPAGSRVGDAIAQAGGEAEDADISRVNRALKLRDEQQVIVPRLRGANVESADVNSTATRVNLNSATLAQLDALPGIGSVIGQRIITYREQHGPFTRTEQLKEAKLVTQATFDKINDLITVQ